VKNNFRILLPILLILAWMAPACNPQDTSTPVQFSYTAVPLRTNLPTLVVTAGMQGSGITSNAPYGSTIPTAAASGLTLFSPDFANNGVIPPKYTCDANSISPDFQFGNIPTGTQSLALTLEDADAPGGVFVHWLIYNMPPSLAGLSEDVPKHADVSGIGRQGFNSTGLAGYTGPCPTLGKAHQYVFTLYALDLKPALPEGLKAETLKAAMQGHILAQAQWIGLYQK